MAEPPGTAITDEPKVQTGVAKYDKWAMVEANKEAAKLNAPTPLMRKAL